MLSKLRSRLQSRNESGFTLIELVIVIVVLGVLTAIAVPTYSAIQHTARQNSVNAVANQAYKAVEAEAAKTGSFSPKTVTAFRNQDIDLSVSLTGTDDKPLYQVFVYWTDDPSINKRIVTEHVLS